MRLGTTSVATLSGVATKQRVRPVLSTPVLSKQLRGLIGIGTVSLFAVMLVTVYLMPLGYSASLSVRGATVEADQPLWPSDPAKFSYNGQDYEIFKVPMDGTIKQLALVRPGRENSTFIDPSNPSQPIE